MKIGRATKFVLMIGCVSLFSDMTYEAARSINGPYLDVLGTSGTVVGAVAGLGELLGYGLRIISGYLSDRTRKYWAIVIFGYILNLVSVPLLALAGYWQLAVILIIGERIGKAIRTPARDAMLSYGSREIGRGWAFGLHDALDSTGATIGPLLVSAVLFFRNQSYHEAYAVLILPAVIAIIILFAARSIYPHPEDLEIKETIIETKGYSKKFWYYLSGTAFIAIGYADFSLIAFHFKKEALIKDAVIPLLYSVAMLVEGLSSLALGRLFDKAGMRVLIIAVLISMCFAPLVFFGSLAGALIGMVLWGIGMGTQESVLKSVVAEIIPANKRGRAFGLFNTFFGVAWFAGSVVMGYLYDVSLISLVVFSMISQLIAFMVLLLFFQQKGKQIDLRAFAE